MKHDEPLNEQELQLFARLRDDLDQAEAEPVDSTLYAGVLERARGHSRLRLVSEHEPAPTSAGSRRHGWALAGLAIAAAAAAVALAWKPAIAPKSTQPPSAGLSFPLVRSELVLAAGQVKVDARPAIVGQGPLVVGQHVTTQRGRACVVIDPQIDVCLAAETEIALESLAEPDLRVRVVRGTAVASLAPRARGHTFSLLSGAVSATARGTVFAVAQAEAGPSVVVMEGKVSVADGTRDVGLVAPHSRWRKGVGPTQGEVSTIGRSEEAQLLTVIAPRQLWQEKSLGMVEITGGAWTDASIGGLGPLPLPLTAFVPVGSRHLALLGAAGDALAAEIDVVAGQTRHVDGARLRPSAAATVSAAPPVNSGESAASLLDRARRELARGGAKAALPLYQRLLAQYPKSAEAATVVVTVGQLELDQRAPARALSAFDGYLKRGGPLAPEALAGKIRALRALGKSAQERAAIEQYLVSYPNGFEAPALRRRLEALR